jgi:peptide/nickel transport system substrate-binding protein
LVKNPHPPTAVTFSEIALQHLPNTAARYYALASGKLAYYFDDLGEGEIPRITGASQPVAMNAMVFLGINGAHKQLAQPTVRQALHLLLDRSATASVYGDYAMPATSLFPAAWAPMAECSGFAWRQDVDAAKALLEQADYPLKGKNVPELRLIYNSDRTDRAAVAEHIRRQADAVGVKITLLPLAETEYRTALADGEYELYLAEYRFTADMSLRPLLLGGKTSYGVAANSAAKAAYTRYLGGEGTLQSFLDAFGTDVPFIPLCYRGGVAAYDRRLTAVTPTGYDPYHGIAEWK